MRSRFCIKWNVWLYLTKSSFPLISCSFFTFFSLFHSFFFQDLSIRLLNMQIGAKLLVIHWNGFKLIADALASSLVLRSKLLKSLRIRCCLELISIRSVFEETIYRHFYDISLFLCVHYVVKSFFILFLYILCFLIKLITTK